MDINPEFCRLYPERCIYNGRLNTNIFISENSAVIPRSTKQNEGQSVKPTAPKTVINSKFNAPILQNYKKPLLAPFEKFKVFSIFRNVAEVSDSVPQYLTDYSKLVKGKETGGYIGLKGGPDSSFSVYTKGDELLVAFRGSTGSTEDTKNVFNVIKNKNLTGDSAKAEQEFLEDLFKSGKANFLGKEYSNVKFVGHSLGGYKARKYGAKYDVDTELLNAHVLPYNSFEPTTAETNFHTIVTDPLDFKMLIQPSEATISEGAINHTYYQPPTKKAYAEAFGGEDSDPRFMEPHYAESFDNLPREIQNDLTESYKVTYPEMFGNTAVAGLSLASSIYQAIHDPNYNPAFDPMLGSAPETGLIGLNIDPDYQWSDSAPPTGADWLIWKALQPLSKAIASPSNPDVALKNAEAFAEAGGSTLSSELFTFNYNGEDYYYQKDAKGDPTWFSDNGAPLSQEIKDAYNSQSVPPAPETKPEQDFTDNFKV